MSDDSTVEDCARGYARHNLEENRWRGGKLPVPQCPDYLTLSVTLAAECLEYQKQACTVRMIYPGRDTTSRKRYRKRQTLDLTIMSNLAWWRCNLCLLTTHMQGLSSIVWMHSRNQASSHSANGVRSSEVIDNSAKQLHRRRVLKPMDLLECPSARSEHKRPRSFAPNSLHLVNVKLSDSRVSKRMKPQDRWRSEMR
jgi:hypothetical protein